MDFLNTIEDNSILLVPSNIKNKILDYIDKNNMLINIKLLTFNDLKKGLMFDYNNQTIYSVMKYDNVNYQTAKSYINNLYYIINDKYDNNKLNHLLEIKNYLNDNNLLIKDPLFKHLISSKSKLYVFGLDYLNKFNKYLLDSIKELIEIIEVDKPSYDYKHEVYELDTMENEVSFIAEEILKLIENGISLNNIYISNYSSDYYYTLHKIFKLYGIPYYIRSETKLSDTSMGKYLINNLCDDLDKLLYKIRNKFDIENNENNSICYDKISALLNNYYWTNSITEVKELLIQECKNISIPVRHYNDEVKVIDIIDNYINDDEYVFFMGFNLGSVPKIYKDEDYINDSIKPSILETTSELNNISNETYSKVLKNIKNITITYKNVSNTSNYFKSFLIDNVYLINKKIDFKYSNYSKPLNNLIYANKIDNFVKFNEHDEVLDLMYSNIEIPYKSYNNQFDGLYTNIIKDTLSTKALSYSSISNYYKCPFRFYLSYLYRLDKYEQTLDEFIGSLFHKVMEECITDDNADIDFVYDNYVLEENKKRNLTEKEKFYVEKLREEVHFIIDNIREQYTYSTHNRLNEWHEKPLTFNNEQLDLDVKCKYILTGIIDKVMFVDNNCVIVDYKTGTSAHIDRDLFEFGINIQLPIYLYLLKNVNKEYNVVGMYLQHILMGLIKRDKENINKSVEQIRTERLKLDGLTLDDPKNITSFDKSADNSNIIKGLKVNNDGYYSHPKRILTKEDENELYNTIKTLLENAINDISDAKFNINPLVIDKKVNGCDYCKYKDICYVRESDKRYEIVEAESGDDNE